MLPEESLVHLLTTLGHDKTVFKGLRNLLFLLKQTGVAAKVSGCLLNPQNLAAHVAQQPAGLKPTHVLNQVSPADKNVNISSKKSSKVSERYVTLKKNTSEPSNEKELEKNEESESSHLPLPEDARWTQVTYKNKNKIISKLTDGASSTSISSKKTQVDRKNKVTLKSTDVGASSTSTSLKINNSLTPTSTKKTVRLRLQTKPPLQKKSSNQSTTSIPVVAVVPSSSISAATADIDSSPKRSARYAGSNSMEITIMDPDSAIIANMPTQQLDGISKEPQEPLTLFLHLRNMISEAEEDSLLEPLTEKKRGQLQRGMKITQKLHLQFSEEIQKQFVQLHLTKFLGPDDDELHSIFAMPNSIITLKIKPPELGPLIRKTWLWSNTITEKKVFLSKLIFGPDPSPESPLT